MQERTRVYTLGRLATPGTELATAVPVPTAEASRFQTVLILGAFVDVVITVVVPIAGRLAHTGGSGGALAARQRVVNVNARRAVVARRARTGDGAIIDRALAALALETVVTVAYEIINYVPTSYSETQPLYDMYARI